EPNPDLPLLGKIDQDGFDPDRCPQGSNNRSPSLDQLGHTRQDTHGRDIGGSIRLFTGSTGR
ncbi:MAG: hypothetical protein QOF65_3115, partial [Thermoleophilaceae bacterium]|nr:hypothetical protein [Thermoleophilaceae bacterium]